MASGVLYGTSDPAGVVFDIERRSASAPAVCVRVQGAVFGRRAAWRDLCSCDLISQAAVSACV